ncbi:hypothetical protein M0813_17430 [Anaeramoeba flamelloides]|uniref:Uncharacterized protein n=1 Tax=Anaeramoeba flamelloides TaxID=1746091 RepID=A0ABQ8YVU5_9EUKA|nr:hypothetical protein M0813_17430 [Anaeramoeba flamelloides]
MGNELPTSVAKKPLKRYLKIVNKHTTPIVVLDQNCCWLDANLSFLKLVSIYKKKRLFRFGLKDFFPKSQSHLPSTKTTQHFLIWFRETKRMESRSNTINLEYETPSKRKGWINCALKFFEIGTTTLSQISISMITKPTKEENEETNLNEKTALSDHDQIKYKKGNLTDNVNKVLHFQKMTVSPSLGSLLNNRNQDELLKLRSSFVSKTRTFLINTSKEIEEQEEKKDEQQKEQENNSESKNETESDSKIERKKIIKSNPIEQNSRTIDESYLDISDGIEEIMKTLNNYEIKEQLSDEIKQLLDKILDVHKSSFFTKQETCKQLSMELLDERKKNKTKYVKMESQMVHILENLQSQKKIKRELLSKNHKSKKKLFALRKSISNLRKTIKTIPNTNKETENQIDNKKPPIIEFADSLENQLIF